MVVFFCHLCILVRNYYKLPYKFAGHSHTFLVEMANLHTMGVLLQIDWMVADTVCATTVSLLL